MGAFATREAQKRYSVGHLGFTLLNCEHVIAMAVGSNFAADETMQRTHLPLQQAAQCTCSAGVTCRLTDAHWILLWLFATSGLTYGFFASLTVTLTPRHFPTNSAGLTCGTNATSPANTKLFLAEHRASDPTISEVSAICVPECSGSDMSWSVCSATASAVLATAHGRQPSSTPASNSSSDCSTPLLTVHGYPSISILHRCIPDNTDSSARLDLRKQMMETLHYMVSPVLASLIARNPD